MEPVPPSNPVALVSPMTTKPVDHSKAFLKRLPTNVSKAVKTSVVDKSQIELGRHCTQKGKYRLIKMNAYVYIFRQSGLLQRGEPTS